MMIAISDRQVHVGVIFAVEVRLVTEPPTLMVSNNISIIGAHQVINPKAISILVWERV